MVCFLEFLATFLWLKSFVELENKMFLNRLNYAAFALYFSLPLYAACVYLTSATLTCTISVLNKENINSSNVGENHHRR